MKFLEIFSECAIAEIILLHCIVIGILKPNNCTQGLIETLGSMVIFDENQAVYDINKYEFLNTIYVKNVNFLVI